MIQAARRPSDFVQYETGRIGAQVQTARVGFGDDSAPSRAPPVRCSNGGTVLRVMPNQLGWRQIKTVRLDAVWR